MAIPKSSLKKRNGTYYLHYFENGVRKRLSLRTNSYRLAQDRQRQFDSARVRGEDTTLSTRTPLTTIVPAYIQHMQARYTTNGYNADLSTLRNMFGPICQELEHGRRSPKKLRIPVDGRLREPVIAVTYLEQITTAQISEFILERVRRHDLQPKTANRYRELLQHLFNWAMQERGVRMPGGVNPASRVKRYKLATTGSPVPFQSQSRTPPPSRIGALTCPGADCINATPSNRLDLPDPFGPMIRFSDLRGIALLSGPKDRKFRI